MPAHLVSNVDYPGLRWALCVSGCSSVWFHFAYIACKCEFLCIVWLCGFILCIMPTWVSAVLAFSGVKE